MRRYLARAEVPLLGLGIVGLTAFVFQDAGDLSFLLYDDDLYVHGNPVVREGLTVRGLVWAWTTFHAGNWHPLTWVSHMADVTLFGLLPGMHHWANVAWHAAAALMLFSWLVAATGSRWRSALVAALFAVHPLHVESVAWVAERRDTLSALFWFAALRAYVAYARRPGRWRYLAVFAAMAAGVLSKPMIVTLPLVLLLLDRWPLERLGPGLPRARELVPLLVEKIPLLALSVLSALVTLAAQSSGGAVSELGALPLGPRVANAAVSYVAYLGQAAWPASLSAHYPHPAILGGPPAWQTAGSLALLGLATWLAAREWSRRPFLPVGWGWYLVTLLPVIGLVQVGLQGRADRYTYLPLVGIFMAAAWLVPVPVARPGRVVVGALAASVVAAYAVAARSQVGNWRDQTTLFRHARATSGSSPFVEFSLANGLWADAQRAHARGGNPREVTALAQEAESHYRAAIDAPPTSIRTWADANYNLGNLLSETGRLPEAVGHYEAAVGARPEDARLRNNLGAAYARSGRIAEAVQQFDAALRIDPDFEDAR